MWPFDEEREIIDDSPESEFSQVSKSIMDQAPDVTSGLEAIRNTYSEYEFNEPEKAREIFVSSSDSLRKRFNDVQPFDSETTYDLAPIDMFNIVPEGDTDEARSESTINKWEQENLRFLSETDDPMYLQSKSQLERGIKLEATMKRRELYAGDNYYITDLGVRAVQGLVSPLAKAAGADSISNYLLESTDPNNDNDYWAAIASGAGSAVGALGSGAIAGLATGGAGTVAGVTGYLALSGIGAVRETVENSLDAEATAGEATAAGLLEGVSQIGQVAVGGKVFGAIAKKALGQSGVALGEKIIPKILGGALLEGTTEGAGQIVSNLAENIGQSKNDSLLEGVPQAFVAGAVVSGVSSVGAEGINKYRQSKTPSQIDPIEELKNVVREVDGDTPPPREAVESPRKSVVPEGEFSPGFTLQDGSEIGIVDGQTVLKAGDKVLNPYESMFFVPGEIGETLRQITQAQNPDGTAITIKKDGNDLVVESEFLNEDFSISPTRTGVSSRKIPVGEPQAGSVPVFANQTRTQNGVRENGFFIAPAVKQAVPDSTVGAASMNTFRTKERGYIKKLRKELGPDKAEQFGFQSTSQMVNPDGSIKEVVTPLMQYFTRTRAEGQTMAENFITEKGPIEALSYITSKEIHDANDQAIGKALVRKAQEAVATAIANNDIDAVLDLQEYEMHVKAVFGEIGTPVAQALAERGNSEGKNKITEIDGHLMTEAKQQIEKEFGEGTTFRKIKEEDVQAEEELAQVEKQVDDPVLKDLAKIDAQIEEVRNAETQERFDKPVEQYTKDIKQLEGELEDLTQEFNKGLTEEEQATRDNIQAHEEAIADTENEIEQIGKEQRAKTIDQPIKQYTEDIQQLQKDLSQKQDEVTNTIKETKQALKEEVASTETEVSNLEKQIEKKQSDGKKVTKAETKKLGDLRSKLNKLTKEVASVDKLKAKQTGAVSKIRKLIADRKVAIRKLNKEAKSPAVTTPRQAKLQEKKLKLVKSLDTLKTQFATAEKRNPKTSQSISKTRSLIAQRKKAIRDLSKQKKTTRPPSAKEVKLLKLKDTILAKKKEGKIPVSPEVEAALRSARAKQAAAKRKLNRAVEILKEKLGKFKPEDRQLLEGWYNARNQLPDGQIRRQLDQAILQKEIELLPDNPTKAQVDRIYNQWRGNLLTGPDTQLRNLGGNITGAISTLAGTTITGGPVQGLMYLDGWAKGLSYGIAEAKEIIKGNIQGRSKADMEGDWLLPAPKISAKRPLGVAAEVARRLMSAGDAVFFRAAVNGQAQLFNYIAATKATNPDGSKLNFEQRRQYIEDKMFNTTEKLARITKEVDAEYDLLRKAGIKVSENQRQLAVFEKAQRAQDETIREVSERHGERAVFQQEPQGVLGMMYRVSEAISKSSEVTINGKKYKTLGYAMPFIRIAANVSNGLLDNTIVGVARGGAGLMWGDAAKGLQYRQTLGQGMVGSLLMGGLFSLAFQMKDDEKPWLQFWGNYPQGKYREWQAQGKTPYTVVIGDIKIPLQNTPLALLPAILGGAMESIKEGKDWTKVAGNAAMASMGAMSTQSFVKPLGDLYNMITGVFESNDKESGKADSSWGNLWKSEVSNLAQGFIPASGLLKNINRYMEASPTETYNDLTAKLFGNLPFAREMGIGKPQLNMFGEPIEKPLIERLSAGLSPSALKTDPTFKWMMETGYRVTEPGPVLKLSDPDIRRYGTIQKDKTGYQDIMDEEQSREVLEISGPQIKQFLESIRTQPQYQVLNDKMQDRINDRVSSIRAQAKLQVLRKPKL